MRANFVFAIGVGGDREDLEKFLELLRADLDHRSVEIAQVIMGGRVQILPLEETIYAEEMHATESEDDGRASDEGEGRALQEDRMELHPVGREPTSEEAEQEDKPRPESPNAETNELIDQGLITREEAYGSDVQ